MIHPKILPPIPTVNPVLAKHFGRPPGHGFYDKYLASNRPKGGWAKVAYVQLVRGHVEVCGAVMEFAQLEKEESMAQRIIMYPREWDAKPQEGAALAPDVETSRRLLRSAAKQYKVMLQPIDSTVKATRAQTTPEERYPLTNLLTLHFYNRVLYLKPAGLILDSTPLDLLFTLPMDSPILGLSAPTSSSATSPPSILLLQPSKSTYRDISSSLPEGAYLDTEFLNLIHVESAPTDAKFHTRLLAETSTLDAENVAEFNATEFLELTGYVHIEDPGMEGPEYDVPRPDFVRAMPSGKQARKAWESVYERYRDARRAVCGLDLESVARQVDEGGEVGMTEELK